MDERRMPQVADGQITRLLTADQPDEAEINSVVTRTGSGAIRPSIEVWRKASDDLASASLVGCSPIALAVILSMAALSFLSEGFTSLVFGGGAVVFAVAGIYTRRAAREQ